MRRPCKTMLSAALAAILSIGTVPSAALADEPALVAASDEEVALVAASKTWTRLSGEDRYGTMAKIAAEGFYDCPTVVIASGASFADALAASSLAGVFESPVLLTPQDALGDETWAQVKSLGAERAYIVGGEASVSAAVVAELEAHGIRCERVAGDNRQQTSVAVLRTVRKFDSEPHDTVLVASGKSFPDALSASPYAWWYDAPILLTGMDGLLTEEESRAVDEFGASQVVVVGGAASVNERAIEQLSDEVDARRIGGGNRYETSARIADWETARGLTFSHPCVASGMNFPDALAGGAFAGAFRSVLVIADSAADATCELLRDNAYDIEGGYLLGGHASLALDDPLEGREVPSDFVPTGKIADLCAWMVRACEEWSLGYDQSSRTDVFDGGECDCSSLVYAALRETGFLPKSIGLGTTMTMMGDLTAVGWKAYPDMAIDDVRPGDILLDVVNHAMVVVEGYGRKAKVAQAAGDENDGAIGGKAGDQLQERGLEGETNVVDLGTYYSPYWDYVLRYEG